MNGAIAGLTARQLLGQRRSLLIVLFAALPVVVAVLYRLGDRDFNPERFTSMGLFGHLLFPLILPLVALIFGTAALGSEIDDGTAVYLLSKPISRWQIAGEKMVVAAGAAGTVACFSALPTAVVAMWGEPDQGMIFGFTLAAVLGAVVYTCVFFALSIVTSRAFIVGLIYAIVWEGLITGLFQGTRVFSVRAYTEGVADALSTVRPSYFSADLSGAEAAVLMVAVSLTAFILGVRALRSFEIGEPG